jgi:hypothetical protein
VLGLEQVFGALAFYIANREMVDEYLSQGKEKFRDAAGTVASQSSCPISEAGQGTPGYARAARA